MKWKSTWVWLAIAAALFAAIYAVDKFGSKPAPAYTALLPNFQASRVTSVQLGLGDQREIHAVRTNDTWQLIAPIVYPAQAASIETLLLVLQQLAPMVTISASEVRQHKTANQDFGFATPQATLTLRSGDEIRPILIGARTAPGDQVYVQVVGKEDVYVVDANLLKLLPRQLDDWRDTALADLSRMLFDRISVSNSVATLELQRDTNQLWRLTRPMSARADNQGVNLALQKLNATRVTRFVTDDPRADGERFGLGVPELELVLWQGTNRVATYQFGGSPTNDSTQVFARRVGLNAIVTVPNNLFEQWRAPLNQFRDPRVVSLTRPVDQVEFAGGEPFTVLRAGSNTWRIAQAPTLPVDAGLVEETVTTLGNLAIEQFKDSVTEADLPRYGLAEPLRHVVLSASVTNSLGPTNLVLAALAFGSTNGEFYVRRADENPVYGIQPADFYRLPVQPWQLRERRIWNFHENEVVRLFFQQQQERRELQRSGTNSWKFAAGSQGILNSFAVEETTHRFGELAATAWVGRGEAQRERFGFGTNSVILTFELKNNTKHTVEFGGVSPENYPYAAVKLEGETWIFEFPIGLHQLMWFALAPASGSP